MTDQRAVFSELVKLTAESGALRKAILSAPLSGSDCLKVTLSLYKTADGKIAVSKEMQMSDGKMIRKNHLPSELFDILTELLPRFARANLLTPKAEAQLMTSKKGKITLIGESNVRHAIDTGDVFVPKSGNNKIKNYIFKGNERWLFELGISTQNGEVHDKKQSKFRQINRFTELLDDVYDKLPREGTLNVCDLCCGKSYLSFAIYAYLTEHRHRDVNMLGVDRKADVIGYCNDTARRIGFEGLRFVASDIGDNNIYKNTFGDGRIHLTVSLHACDIATDIVLRRATKISSEVILSTPCCHHELYGKLNSPSLSFITSHSMLAQKLNDAVTDGLRVKMLEIEGYKVDTVELVDPEETPKNVLIRAIKRNYTVERKNLISEYNAIIDFLGINGSYYDIYR